MSDPNVTGDLARAQGLAEVLRDHPTTGKAETAVAREIVELIEGARAGLSNPAEGGNGEPSDEATRAAAERTAELNREGVGNPGPDFFSTPYARASLSAAHDPALGDARSVNERWCREDDTRKWAQSSGRPTGNGERESEPLGLAEARFATGAVKLAHLLAVLRDAAKLLDESGCDVDAKIVQAHAAQLARGYEWPGDEIAPETVEPDLAARSELMMERQNQSIIGRGSAGG